MVTILLADDERIFKVVQGTLLRREACRLLKAPFGSLPALAVEHSPDLVIVPAAARDAAVDRLASEMRARRETRGIPIIILDMDASESDALPAPLEQGTGAPIEIIRAGAGPDPDRLQPRLAAAFEKLLDLKGRGTERIAADVPVSCTLGSSRFTARTKDISSSGLFLKTDRGVHAGDRLTVSFRLPAEGSTAAAIDGECEVVRLIAKDRDDPDLIPGAGLRFVRLTKQALDVLARFAPPAPDRKARSEPGHVSL